MKIKNILCALVFAAMTMPANSRITADVSSVHVEGNTFRARGVKLSNKNNPAKAWVENLDGTNKTFLSVSVNKKKNAIRVDVPLVNTDTKMKFFSSGGDVPESNPQEYFLVVLDNPSLNVTTSTDLPTVTGGENSSVGGVVGPQGPIGPQGARGEQGIPGFIYDGNRDIDSLPDYVENYQTTTASLKRNVRPALPSQQAGEITIGTANAVSIVDSNTLTDDVLGLIVGDGSVGQKVTLIVDNFFFLALSNFLFMSNRERAPVPNSIVAPDFYFNSVVPKQVMGDANVADFNRNSISVSRYQLVPIFPGMVIELVFDGTQWRVTNLPFYFDFCLQCVG